MMVMMIMMVMMMTFQNVGHPMVGQLRFDRHSVGAQLNNANEDGNGEARSHSTPHLAEATREVVGQDGHPVIAARMRAYMHARVCASVCVSVCVSVRVHACARVFSLCVCVCVSVGLCVVCVCVCV